MTPRLDPPLSGPTLRAPSRTARAPAPRRSRGIGRWLLGIALVLTAVVFIPVIAWRWIPPPITAFMLMSPVKPVQYEWVPRSRIAEVARKAVVAAEDQKFWEHQGFDLEAIEKAVKHNRTSRKKRGASTISQQTAKNLFLWSGGGYFRKGMEAGYTVLIEALWPKERILEMYLNIAEFGPGIYGVEAAAQHYFRKPASALTASEAARLAAILPSPRRWSVKNPGPYVQKRASWILGQMGYGPRRSEPAEEPPLPPELEHDLDLDEDAALGLIPPPPQDIPPLPAAAPGLEAPTEPADAEDQGEAVERPAAEAAPVPSPEAPPAEAPVEAPVAPAP